jgi:CRP-like cAMP-binding protein
MHRQPITPRHRADLARLLEGRIDTKLLTRREIHDFFGYCDSLGCAKGEIIADIGDVGESLFFVLEGEALLTVQMPHGEMEVGRILPGEILGEMSFFDRTPREVRLRAAADTRFLRLTRKLYERMRFEHPILAVMMLEVCITSLDRLYRRTSKDISQMNRYMHWTGR